VVIDGNFHNVVIIVFLKVIWPARLNAVRAGIASLNNHKCLCLANMAISYKLFIYFSCSLAISTSLPKATISVTAKSAIILRLTSTPALLKPLIKRL